MRKYLRYLEHNLGRDHTTVYQAELAIADLERTIDEQDYRQFHGEWIDADKSHLQSYVSPLTKKPLPTNSRIAKLRAVRQFMGWLC